MPAHILDSFSKFVTKLRHYGLEYTSARYYSKYAGDVASTDDSQGQGRIRVVCEEVTGHDQPMGGNAYPSSPFAGDNYGLFLPPEVGDQVWVWFDKGDPQQPHASGSFWANPGSGRKPGTSHVPVEFHTDGSSPTRRGLKTKQGHGWFFEDAEATGRRWELWTGEQVEEGAEAEKHHRFYMTELSGGEEVAILTYGGGGGGHSTVWSDRPADQYVETKTKDGHSWRMDDTKKTVAMTSKEGIFWSADDNTDVVLFKTKSGFQATLSTAANANAFSTPGGRLIQQSDGLTSTQIIDGPLRFVALDSKTGFVTVQDTAVQSLSLTTVGATLITDKLLTLTAGAAAVIAAGATLVMQAGGAVTLSGAGVSVVSSGVGLMDMTGLFTVKAAAVAGTITGLLALAVGTFTLVGASTIVQSPIILLGTGAPLALVDERFIAAFNLHTHPPAGGPPIIPIVPAAVSTTNTKAS